MFEIHLGVPEMEELWNNLEKNIMKVLQPKRKRNCAGKWGKQWRFFRETQGIPDFIPMKHLPYLPDMVKKYGNPILRMTHQRQDGSSGVMARDRETLQSSVWNHIRRTSPTVTGK